MRNSDSKNQPRKLCSRIFRIFISSVVSYEFGEIDVLVVRVALAQDRINYFKMQVVLLHLKLLRLFWYFYQIWLFYSVSYYSRSVILNWASPGTRIFQTFHVRVHVHQTLELSKFWYHYMSRIKDLVVSCFGEILFFTWRTNSLQMFLYHWLSLLSSFIKNITVSAKKRDGSKFEKKKWIWLII